MQIQVELVIHVLRKDVVNGKLDSEAVTVRERHDPCAVVSDRGLPRAPSVDFLHAAGLAESCVVSVWHVLAEGHGADSEEDLEGGGDKEGPTPGLQDGENRGRTAQHKGEKESVSCGCEPLFAVNDEKFASIMVPAPALCCCCRHTRYAQ